MRCTVYALVDPRDGQRRYVGMTSRPLGERRAAHLKDAMAPDNPKQAWIDELRRDGALPVIEPLQQVWGEHEAAAAERKWIVELLLEGANLVNIADMPGWGFAPASGFVRLEKYRRDLRAEEDRLWQDLVKVSAERKRVEKLYWARLAERDPSYG